MVAYIPDTKDVGVLRSTDKGKFGGHIDHIKPLCAFNLMDVEQQKLAFHYTNLQPLWWRENLTKGRKITPFETNTDKPSQH